MGKVVKFADSVFFFYMTGEQDVRLIIKQHFHNPGSYVNAKCRAKALQA